MATMALTTDLIGNCSARAGSRSYLRGQASKVSADQQVRGRAVPDLRSKATSPVGYRGLDCPAVGRHDHARRESHGQLGVDRHGAGRVAHALPASRVDVERAAWSS